MTSLQNTSAVFLMGLLTACGGGGSSNGGGSSEVDEGEQLKQYAGTYEGTLTATVSLESGLEQLLREVRFVVSGDGQTISVENESFPLDSKDFEITVQLPLANTHATCILDSTFKGTLQENLISSTVSGSGDCHVEGQGALTGELSGYLGASKI